MPVNVASSLSKSGALQKAVVKACRNAIEFNSIPCVKQLVPNGYDGLVVNDEVDVLAVKNCFPYGKVCVQLVQGGLEAQSGVRIKELGDSDDTMLIANVAVTVGYGLHPESMVEV